MTPRRRPRPLWRRATEWAIRAFVAAMDWLAD